MRQQVAINILMKDGTPRRIPRDQANSLIDSGKAKRYISNTVYKALKLGIEVKNHGTRDDDGSLRSAINAARTKASAKKHKADAKKKDKEADQADD